MPERSDGTISCLVDDIWINDQVWRGDLMMGTLFRLFGNCYWLDQCSRWITYSWELIDGIQCQRGGRDKFTFGFLLGSEFIYCSRYNKALAQRWTQHKGFDAGSNSVLQKGCHATVKHSKMRTADSRESVFFYSNRQMWSSNWKEGHSLKKRVGHLQYIVDY